MLNCVMNVWSYNPHAFFLTCGLMRMAIPVNAAQQLLTPFQKKKKKPLVLTTHLNHLWQSDPLLDVLEIRGQF